MRLVREVTEFSGINLRNHDYLLNNSGNALGYRKFGSGPVVRFSKPLELDHRGRKFELLDDLGPDEPQPRAKEVVGSRGEVYYVQESSCTCPSFKFRGRCKHLEQ